MTLQPLEIIITIVAIALGAQVSRFLPFLLFPDGKPLPPFIEFLGKTLPPAMMGLLVVYSLKNVSFVKAFYGLPELASILLIIIIHKLKRNLFLSITLGTVLYMVLVQYVFKQ